MKICLSVDVEQDLHLKTYKGLNEGLSEYFNLLKKRKIKSTLFVPARLIKQFPNLFINFEKDGNEIALHGLDHERFDDLIVLEKDKRISEAVKIYESVLGHKPFGFRAPQHSIDEETLNVLAKQKFLYDSSYTPFNPLQLLFFPKRIIHGLNGFLKARNKYTLKQGIEEIPISSIGIPFVSLTLRILPKNALKYYFVIMKGMHKNLVFYCHSWDLIKLSRSKIDRTFSHKRLIENLDYLVNHLAKHDEFILLKDLIKEKG